MGNKNVETLGSKIWFSSILDTSSSFPTKQCWFFYFLDSKDLSAYTSLNWGGAEGVRELMLDANKIGREFKYRNASFPRSVSTTFVAHCIFSLLFVWLIFSIAFFFQYVFVFCFSSFIHPDAQWFILLFVHFLVLSFIHVLQCNFRLPHAWLCWVQSFHLCVLHESAKIGRQNLMTSIHHITKNFTNNCMHSNQGSALTYWT